MTTIIFANGTIYSDSQMSVLGPTNEILSTFNGQKIFKHGNKVCAGAGPTALVEFFKDKMSALILSLFKRDVYWSMDDHNINSFSHITGNATIISVGKRTITSTILIANRKYITIFGRKITLLYVRRRRRTYSKATTEYIAIGSGQDCANEFLKAGYSPDNAIRMSAECDPYTNDIVVSQKC
jgi:hypothetical protein